MKNTAIVVLWSCEILGSRKKMSFQTLCLGCKVKFANINSYMYLQGKVVCIYICVPTSKKKEKSRGCGLFLEIERTKDVTLP